MTALSKSQGFFYFQSGIDHSPQIPFHIGVHEHGFKHDMSIQAFVCLWLNDWAGHTVDINAAVLATNLTDGAHGPHVAFIS